MRKYSLPRYALLNGVIATMLWSQPAQSAGRPVGDVVPVKGEHDATQTSAQASPQGKDLDDLYHSLLRDSEASAAKVRQRPWDAAALRSNLAELRNEITALRELSKKVKQEAKPAPFAKGAAKESTAPAPAGPVQPSQSPSPEEEVQARRKATEDRFLSVPVGHSPETRTLVGVPKFWIERSCAQALEEMDKIDSLLRAEPLDRDAVQMSLQELRATISNLGSPPSTARPVKPRTPKH